MNRRDLFTAVGVGGLAFMAGQARADHILVDDYCHSGDGNPLPPPPPPEDDPLPPREDWGADNLFFKNKTGLVLENFKLEGRIQIIDCPGVIVRNFEIFGQHAGKWGNLILVNCPEAVVEAGESHDNPAGHGLFLREDMNGTVVSRFKAWNCEEDGVQTDNNAFGMVRLTDCELTNNYENALDIKGGSVCVLRGRFQTRNVDMNGKSHEPLLIHNYADTLHVERARIVDTPHPSRVKALLHNVNEGGKVILENCEYEIARDHKWIRADGTAYDLPDLGEPFNLVTPTLTVTGGKRV